MNLYRDTQNTLVGVEEIVLAVVGVVEIVIGGNSCYLSAILL